MFFRTLIIFSMLSFTWIVKAEPKTDTHNKSQLESLLIWKMSDEMKLGPAEEKKFSEIFLEMNKKKAAISASLEAAQKNLIQAKTDKERAQYLGEYRKYLQQLHQLPILEFDRMKALFGASRVAKYLEVKQDLTQKVKSLILEKAEKKELPKPKIIE